jgi:hypothetical protein
MLENFTNQNVNSLSGSDEQGDDGILDRQTVSCNMFTDCNLLTLSCGKAYIEPGGAHIRPDINSHWASAMADTIKVLGCSCIWCRRTSGLVSTLIEHA